MDRREMIVGAGSAAAVIAASPLGTKAANPTPDRTAWNKAMEAYNEVKARDAAFSPNWWSLWQECKAECDRIPPADAEVRKEQIQLVRDRYDMDALDREAEALGDEMCDCASQLMELPAPDLAALRWKIEHLTDGLKKWACWSDEFVAQIFADIVEHLPNAR